jgi:hypothetical protein
VGPREAEGVGAPPARPSCKAAAPQGGSPGSRVTAAAWVPLRGGSAVPPPAPFPPHAPPNPRAPRSRMLRFTPHRRGLPPGAPHASLGSSRAPGLHRRFILP